MTLPVDITFPWRDRQIITGGKELAEYIRDLLNTLTDMYQSIAQNVNGALREFTPIVQGLTGAGTGTYTYQTGWLLRRGIIVDIWFSVAWTAHTGTGDTSILLPFQVAKSQQEPFVGTIESVGSNAFGAGYTYLVLKGLEDTFSAVITKCGSGVPSAPLAMAATGSYVGHIRYIGKEFEN